MTMKAIPGYEGYFADETGEIWSDRNGQLTRLTASMHKRKGYMRVCVRVNGKTKTPYVHTLMLLAFIGPRPPGCETRHKNGNRTDNWIDNLAWGTRQENADDRLSHGTQIRGQDVHSSKLTPEQVKELRSLNLAGWGCRRLARIFGLNRTSVLAICKRESWKHV